MNLSFPQMYRPGRADSDAGFDAGAAQVARIGAPEGEGSLRPRLPPLPAGQGVQRGEGERDALPVAALDWDSTPS